MAAFTPRIADSDPKKYGLSRGDDSEAELDRFREETTENMDRICVEWYAWVLTGAVWYCQYTICTGSVLLNSNSKRFGPFFHLLFFAPFDVAGFQ